MRLEDEILQFLQNVEEPKSLIEISQSCDFDKESTSGALNKLIDEGKVFTIRTTRNVYYAIERKATWDNVANMYNEISQKTIVARDNYNELNERIENIGNNVNGIYANIISIMAVFVAVFALITVNANITFKLTQNNMCHVFWGIVVINIVVVICIIALLLGVRIIIINPLLGKIKDKKEKRKRG